MACTIHKYTIQKAQCIKTNNLLFAYSVLTKNGLSLKSSVEQNLFCFIF